MIEGAVNADYEAVVTLALRGQAGQAREIEVVIDTGYNGFLSLPPALVDELELPMVGPSQATLANGVVETFNVHDATVVWDGMPRDIEADPILVAANLPVMVSPATVAARFSSFIFASKPAWTLVRFRRAGRRSYEPQPTLTRSTAKV